MTLRWKPPPEMENKYAKVQENHCNRCHCRLLGIRGLASEAHAQQTWFHANYGNVNMRSGPSTGSSVVGLLVAGNSVASAGTTSRGTLLMLRVLRGQVASFLPVVGGIQRFRMRRQPDVSLRCGVLDGPSIVKLPTPRRRQHLPAVVIALGLLAVSCTSGAGTAESPGGDLTARMRTRPQRTSVARASRLTTFPMTGTLLSVMLSLLDIGSTDDTAALLSTNVSEDDRIGECMSAAGFQYSGAGTPQEQFAGIHPLLVVGPGLSGPNPDSIARQHVSAC